MYYMLSYYIYYIVLYCISLHLTILHYITVHYNYIIRDSFSITRYNKRCIDKLKPKGLNTNFKSQYDKISLHRCNKKVRMKRKINIVLFFYSHLTSVSIAFTISSAGIGLKYLKYFKLSQVSLIVTRVTVSNLKMK